VDENELKQRTKQFALRCLRLVAALPKTVEGRTVAGQLADSSTSVASNYRAACRGRSRAEFASKLGTVEEEADESAFWLEIVMEHGMLPEERVAQLLKEANELVAIMVASRLTVSSRGGSSIANRKSKI
jgi:four helix bundle protein